MTEYDDLPREHVLRPALPWRDEELTECGRKPGEHILTRDAFIAKVRKLGKTRAAMTTCMTCFETAQRWPDWNANPVAVIAREVKHFTFWGAQQQGPLKEELRAIALLVEAHREEFDETLAALRATVPLARPRRQGRRTS